MKGLRINLIGASRAGISMVEAMCAQGAVFQHAWNKSAFDWRALKTQPRSESCGFEQLTAACGACDWLIIAVRDDAIQTMAARVAQLLEARCRPFVLHFSGCLSRDGLKALAALGCETATLHPLRSFPEVLTAPFLRGVFCALEGEADAPDFIRLTQWLDAEGARYGLVNSAHKARYHLAATLASNGVLALMDMAMELMAQAGVSKDETAVILSELTHGCLAAAIKTSPSQAMTGPASRGDLETLKKHREVLDQLGQIGRSIQEVYPPLTTRIAEISLKSGRLDQQSLDAVRRIVRSEDL